VIAMLSNARRAGYAFSMRPHLMPCLLALWAAAPIALFAQRVPARFTLEGRPLPRCIARSEHDR
jgi:hypothetical protein